MEIGDTRTRKFGGGVAVWAIRPANLEVIQQCNSVTGSVLMAAGKDDRTGRDRSSAWG